jgi:hypothetical protein
VSYAFNDSLASVTFMQESSKAPYKQFVTKRQSFSPDVLYAVRMCKAGTAPTFIHFSFMTLPGIRKYAKSAPKPGVLSHPSYLYLQFPSIRRDLLLHRSFRPNFRKHEPDIHQRPYPLLPDE